MITTHTRLTGSMLATLPFVAPVAYGASLCPNERCASRRPDRTWAWAVAHGTKSLLAGMLVLVAAACGASDRELQSGDGGGSGGGMASDASNCPGVVVEEQCAYMPDTKFVERLAAVSSCESLGAGWELCPPLVLCQPATYSYLTTAGCDCGGGAEFCGRKHGVATVYYNLYIHTTDATGPYGVRHTTIPNCVGEDSCGSSTNYTTGAPLCCREHP